MTTTPGGPGDPDGDDPDAIDREFEQIVSQLDVESPGTESSPVEPPRTAAPDARDPDRDWSEWDDVRPAGSLGDGGGPDDGDDPDQSAAASDDDHYVPPPPPPVPRGDRITRWAWAGAVGAPLLAALLVLAGQRLDGLLGLGLLAAFLGGFVTLLARLRTGPRIDDGPDDGAVV